MFSKVYGESGGLIRRIIIFSIRLSFSRNVKLLVGLALNFSLKPRTTILSQKNITKTQHVISMKQENTLISQVSWKVMVKAFLESSQNVCKSTHIKTHKNQVKYLEKLLKTVVTCNAEKKSQFRSKNTEKLFKENEKTLEGDTDYASDDYYQDESSLEVEMSQEDPTVPPTSNLFDAKKLMSCFMKDFDFGSNFEEFLPNLRYEKCYLACKQKKG